MAITLTSAVSLCPGSDHAHYAFASTTTGICTTDRGTSYVTATPLLRIPPPPALPLLPRGHSTQLYLCGRCRSAPSTICVTVIASMATDVTTGATTRYRVHRCYDCRRCHHSLPYPLLLRLPSLPPTLPLLGLSSLVRKSPQRRYQHHQHCNRLVGRSCCGL